MAKTGKMTVQAASRIYSPTATKGGGSVGKNTFGVRAMSAAMRPAAQSAVQGGGKAAGGSERPLQKCVCAVGKSQKNTLLYA